MKVVLTEFDKAILLGVLVVAKGSTEKGMTENEILLRFPMRQRKNARNCIQRLLKFKLLRKETKKFFLTEEGLKTAKKLLIEGAPIWKGV